jgi:outer membrane protein assembly factor BamB
VYRVIHLPPDLQGVTDPGLRALIAACLDKDPARRPDAERLLRHLAVPDTATPHGTGWLPPPVAHDIAHRGHAPRPGPTRRRVLIFGAGGAAVLGAAAAGGVTLLRAGGPPKVRWSFTLPDEMSVMTGPAALSGTVYAGGRSGFTTQTFALGSRTGKVRWTGNFSPALNTVPVVSGGRGFVCDGGGVKGSVASFDVASGQTRWTTPIGSFAHAPALVVTGDVVCIAGSDGVGSYGVYAFGAAGGERRWRYRTDEMIQGNVTLSGGLLYFGSENGFLYAIDAATGGGRWQQQVGDISEGTPVVQDGVMVLATQDYTIRAFDPATGRQRWKVALGAAGTVGEEVTPLVTGGTVYVGRAGTLHALDAATGRARWTFTAGQAQTSGSSNHLTPAVRGGLAVLSAKDGTVSALDTATGKARWQRPTGTGSGDRPVILGNAVYQATFDGVHGFDLTTGRPVFRLGESDFPPDLGASADNLGAEGGLLFCAIGSTTICALDPAT